MKLEQVLVSESNISAELKQPLPDRRKRIHAVRVEPEFAKDLGQYGVKFSGSKAAGILKQNRELLDQTAEMLLTKETLSADELPKRVPFMTVPAPAAAAGGSRAGA